MNEVRKYKHIPTNTIYKEYNNFFLKSDINNHFIPLFVVNNSKDWQKCIHTTKDGVNLYGGETVWCVCLKNGDRENILWEVFYSNDSNVTVINDRKKYKQSIDTEYVTFISKEKAEQYIKDNSKLFLFTTEDGIKIYRGDPYVIFSGRNAKNGDGDIQIGYNALGNSPNYYLKSDTKFYFSTKSKAEEWVEKRKQDSIYDVKCLSINDVAKVYVTANRKPQPITVHGKRVMMMGKQPEALLNLVKQQIKK